jgi:thioredoxin-dependent peroxiredoxin
MALSEGQKAPDFKLPWTEGGDLDLAALRGRKAVLFFYPKDDTSGCTREALDFDALLAKFEAAGTRVVGISVDDMNSHARFREKHGLSLPLASDPDKRAVEAYGVWAEKSMYGRKYMGTERTTVLLDRDGRIARIWPKVKVPGHAEEVLAAAQAL